MDAVELSKILDKHKLWLESERGGERADLRHANLGYADLRHANLGYAYLGSANLGYADLRHANLGSADLGHADLRHVDLGHADLRHANLGYADLRHANLDFSCLPLWCGGLKMHIDDKQAIQILYHLLSSIRYSKNVSEENKKLLLTDEIMELANKFHRIDECGRINNGCS